MFHETAIFCIFPDLSACSAQLFQSVYSKCQRLEVFSGENTPEIFRVCAAVCRRHGSFALFCFL